MIEIKSGIKIFKFANSEMQTRLLILAASSKSALFVLQALQSH